MAKNIAHVFERDEKFYYTIHSSDEVSKENGPFETKKEAEASANELIMLMTD